MATDDDDPIYPAKKAADYLGCSGPTLDRKRSDGTGPRFARLGPGVRSRILYRKSDLDAWLDENSHGSTSEYRGNPKPRR